MVYMNRTYNGQQLLDLLEASNVYNGLFKGRKDCVRIYPDGGLNNDSIPIKLDEKVASYNIVNFYVVIENHNEEAMNGKDTVQINNLLSRKKYAGSCCLVL